MSAQHNHIDRRIANFTTQVTLPAPLLPPGIRSPFPLREVRRIPWSFHDAGSLATPRARRGGHVAELLRAYTSEAMRAYRVSTAVNNVKNYGPECIEPAA